MIPGELHRDAKIVINWEFVTLEHLRPGKAIGLHDRSTAVPDGFAQRAAGVNGPIQAHRSKQGAKKHLCVCMAALGQKGYPAACLLHHLRHGLMVQQIGKSHLFVANSVAKT